MSADQISRLYAKISAVEQNLVFPRGKTVKEKFLDEAQFELLKKDLSDFSDNADFKEKITVYLESLRESNVILHDFSFEESERQFRAKAKEQLLESFSAEKFYEQLEIRQSLFEVTQEQFETWFCCNICFKVIDATDKKKTKACTNCNYICCKSCYLKLSPKRCPKKCEAGDSFTQISTPLF